MPDIPKIMEMEKFANGDAYLEYLKQYGKWQDIIIDINIELLKQKGISEEEINSIIKEAKESAN